MLKNKKYGGFTLLEMLVVVLIIGILAGIALPQYEKAVIKARVSSILPLMRRWHDGMIEYKLKHGSYLTEDDDYPDGSEVGANWPSDWECDESGLDCANDYWDCISNDDASGSVICSQGHFSIWMYQDCKDLLCGKTTCYASDAEGHKICKALGGKLIEELNVKREYKLY